MTPEEEAALAVTAPGAATPSQAALYTWFLTQRYRAHQAQFGWPPPEPVTEFAVPPPAAPEPPPPPLLGGPPFGRD